MPDLVPIQLRLAKPAPALARGFALTSKGFRPLFLLAGVYAASTVPLWLLILTGNVALPSSFGALSWHAHEMLFGYTAAVIAGFLLTAAARWTDRETVVGPGLVALCALWVLGRVAMWMPLPAAWIALADLVFIPAVAFVVGRAIVAASNRRNYGVLALLSALFFANGLAHLEHLGVAPGWSRRGFLFGIDMVVTMMLVIGGRVIPMFTRNATAVAEIRASPRLDMLAIASALLGAVLQLATSQSALLALCSGLAGALALARMRHWGVRASLRDPMLWVLHLGHMWMGLGFALRAAASWLPVLAASATHAFTAGAIGTLTLGMMTRVALGHTGRLIRASALTRWAFIAVSAAALTRVAAPLLPAHYLLLLMAAGACWSLAFACFVFEYAPVLIRPRVDGAPG